MKTIVVGCGSIGQRHLKNLRSIGIQDLIAVDLDSKRLIVLKKYIPGLKTYTNLNDALEKECPIAAGFVCTPTAFHIPVATVLAKAKINLFIEKPLSNNFKGVKALEALVKKNKLITMMGMNYRFHPGLKLVRKMVENKKIGEILSARVFGGHYLPYWHPNTDYRKEYAARRELGGGVILTSLSHTLDYLTWIFGDINLLYTWKGNIGDLEINVEDAAIMVLETKKNKPILVYSDFLQQNNQHDLEIAGTKGSIKFDFLSKNVQVYSDNSNKWQTIIYKFEINDMYIDEEIYFIKYVKMNKNITIDLQSGINPLKVLIQSKNK